MQTLKYLIPALLACCALPASRAAETPDPAPAPQIEEDEIIDVTVQGKRIQPPARMDRVETYDADYIDRADAFTVQELVDTLPEGPAGTRPVIFIDGQETPFDLSTLPVELIERLEVNLDGERPDGRPRAAGQVINIITREDYTGAGLNARQGGSFEGGGGSRQLTANATYKKGGLHTTFTATHSERAALLASQRAFSREQDRSAWGGRDFRIPWGTEATTASGQAFFNTADYLYLDAPGENSSVGLQARYPLTPRITLNTQYNFSWSEHQRLAPPPVTPASERTVVPAAYSPTGEAVAVGLVHEGFGPVRNAASLKAHTFFAAANGWLGDAWRWDSRLTLARTDSDTRSRELDEDLFSAALSAADPAQRFNPFAPDAALYPALTRVREGASLSQNTSLQLGAQGALSEGWAGPLMLRMSAERSGRRSEQVETRWPGSPGDSLSRADGWRANANLEVPVFKPGELWEPVTWTFDTQWSRDEHRFGGERHVTTADRDIALLSMDTAVRIPWVDATAERPWLRQLETRLGVGQSRQSGEEAAHTQNLSVLWSPLQAITVRAAFNENQSPPPGLFHVPRFDYHLTLTDPARDAAAATGVQVTSGAPAGLKASFNRTQMLEVRYAPPRLKDFSIGLNYHVQTQRNQVRHLSAQDIVDNEAALPGRVQRLAPTAEDLAAGQPGAIASVDITPLNAGSQYSRNLDLSVAYRGRDTGIGAFNFQGRVRRTLDRENELLPGVPMLTTNTQDAPPDWTFTGQADWQRGPWSVRGELAHRAEGYYAGLPYTAFTTVDLSLGYRFEQPLWGSFGRRLRIGAEIDNLFDEQPPQVNTVTGFHGGSALGRTFQITLRMPLAGNGGRGPGPGSRSGGGRAWR